MQKIMKRSIALLLAIMLCFSGLPFSAFASELQPDEPVASEAPPSDEPTESGEPDELPAPEPTEAPGPADPTEPTPSPEPTAEPTEQPESIPTPPSEPSGGDDPYETEGASIDVTKVWPTGPRRAAIAASVGASSVLKIGNYCFADEVGTLPTLGAEIYHLPAKTLLSGGKHIAAYCLDEHLGATDGMDYTWSSLSKSNQEVIGTIDDKFEGKVEIGTTATVDGEKIAEPLSEVTIVDTVRYSGLTAGKTYKLTGVLMDKATGEPLISFKTQSQRKRRSNDAFSFGSSPPL